MSQVTSQNALVKDSTLQDVADAIETMSATSVGNMAALQTTDKTSLVGAVNELKSGLIEKVDQLTLVESSSQSDDDAIKNLFDDINIYDKPIVGAMGFQSWWVYIAYKYTGGNYGCIVAYRFDGTAKFLSVNAGVKTIKSFAFGS